MDHFAFSTDFTSARSRFVEAAERSGATLHSYDYPARGPLDEELRTDVAWLGPEGASRVLVMASGTHGVEGFCGSGAQIEWLRRYNPSLLPPDTAVMLIHAVNPYGFAWRRRVTHENIDLNRNWIDFERPLPENTGYDEIATTVCPRDWTQSSRAQTQGVLQQYVAQHGFATFVQTVSGGQYKHETGIFFGGTGPAASRLTLTSILTDHLARAERLGIIDFHSGLGPFGIGELITPAPLGSPAYDRARSWYGRAVTPVGTQGEEFAKVGGDWLSAVSELLPRTTVTPIALEFGTVGPLQVLEALRADNWLHNYGDPKASSAEAIKQQLLDAFYVDSDVWRGMVLGQALLACKHAISGLSA